MTTPTTTASTGEVLIDADGVGKSFRGAAGDDLRVLDSIDLQLRTGEIVALLGQIRIGQVDIAQDHRRSDPVDQRLSALPRSRAQRREPGRGTGVPILRADAVAHRPGQRRTRIGRPKDLARRTPGTCARRDRHDRP